MFEVWLQMSDTNIDTENPSDLPALPYSEKRNFSASNCLIVQPTLATLYALIKGDEKGHSYFMVTLKYQYE